MKVSIWSQTSSETLPAAIPTAGESGQTWSRSGLLWSKSGQKRSNIHLETACSQVFQARGPP